MVALLYPDLHEMPSLLVPLIVTHGHSDHPLIRICIVSGVKSVQFEHATPPDAHPLHGSLDDDEELELLDDELDDDEELELLDDELDDEELELLLLLEEEELELLLEEEEDDELLLLLEDEELELEELPQGSLISHPANVFESFGVSI